MTTRGTTGTTEGNLVSARSLSADVPTRSAGVKADRVFDTNRERMLDREGLEQDVTQLKGKLADLREEHAELKARVRAKEKDSLRKDRLLAGLLADARLDDGALDEAERAQEELQLLLQHKKHAFELRAQVEDREQTIHGIQVELRSSRGDSLKAEVEGLQRSCVVARDHLDGLDVEFTAQITALRAQADAAHQKTQELENRLAEQLGRAHQLGEQTKELKALQEKQTKQAGELQSMCRELLKATPEEQAGPDDLAALRDKEQGQVAELEALQLELRRLEALSSELSSPTVGSLRVAGWRVPAMENSERDRVVAQAVRRAHYRLGQRGCGLADAFAERDLDKDLLVSPDEALNALQPLAVQLTRADVQLVAGTVGGQVPFVPLLTLLESREAELLPEDCAAIVDACRMRRISRPVFLQEVCASDGVLNWLLSLGLSRDCADRVLDRCAELAWRLPGWTVLEKDDAKLLLQRFFQTFDHARAPRPRQQYGTLADFRAFAPGADDDVAVALAVEGLVDLDEVLRVAQTESWTEAKPHVQQAESPDADAFSDDFEADTDEDDP